MKDKTETQTQLLLTIIVSLELASSFGLGRWGTTVLLLRSVLGRFGEVGLVAETEETHLELQAGGRRRGEMSSMESGRDQENRACGKVVKVSQDVTMIAGLAAC